MAPATPARSFARSVIREILEVAPEGAIDLGLGEPDFPTCPALCEEASRAVRAERLGYTRNAGLPELRRAILDHFGLDPERFEACVTNGAQEALFCILLAYVGAGDRVAIPDPGFLAYPPLTTIAGGDLLRYRVHPAVASGSLDRGSLAGALAERPKVVLLNSPANPTGNVLDAEELRFAAEEARSAGALVVSDEVYREIYFTESRPPSLFEVTEDGLVVSSLSKSHCATGWRLGWVIGSRELLSPIIDMHQMATTCASAVSQRAAIRALTTEDGRSFPSTVRERVRKNRDDLVETLRRELNLEVPPPAGAFYATVPVGRWGSGREVAKKLLPFGVVVVPGDAFGEPLRDFVRVSFAMPQERLAEGLSRLVRGLKSIG